MSATTELTTTIETASRQIAEVVQKCGTLSNTGSDIAASIQRGRGMTALRGIIQGEILNELMQLRGTRLGFRTDKDHLTDKNGNFNGYKPEEIRDCLIEGLLQGAHVTNDEINIIANGCFLTKNFYARKLNETEGFSSLQTQLAVPELNGGFALVECSATWTFHGEQQSISFQSKPTDNRISVKINSGQGHDQATGKAERKLLRAIWLRVTGQTSSADDGRDGSVDDAIPATVINTDESAKLRDSMINRIADAAFYEELKTISDEKDEAIRVDAMTLEDSKLVRENLNAKAKELNPPQEK